MAEYKQNQLIKQIEAEAEAQEISSPERSDFLNQARLGGGGCEEVVLFLTWDHPSTPHVIHLWRYDHATKTKIPMVC